MGELFDIYDHKIFPASDYEHLNQMDDDDEETKAQGPGSNEGSFFGFWSKKLVKNLQIFFLVFGQKIGQKLKF